MGTTTSLEEYRAILDSIDVEILDALRRRIEIVSKIAQYKRANSIPMMQPARIGIVTERAIQFATENEISVEYLKSLYELIIEESCRLEDLIIQNG
jgi:chorismate mutase-like protein